MSDPARVDRTLIDRAFDALDGTAWVVLRGHPDDARGDLDLAVDDPGLGGVREAWRSLGFAETRSMPRAHATTAAFVAYEPDADRWILLDVTDGIAFGGVYLAVADLSRALRRDGTMRRPAADDGWWLDLLHELAERRSPRPDRLERLVADLPSEAAVGPSAPGLRAAIDVVPGLPKALQAVIAVLEADFDERARAWDAARAALGVQATTPVARGRTVVERRLGRRAESVCVALLGPDGVGKSTLAASLRGPRQRPLERIYLGLYGRGPDAVASTTIPGLGLALRLVALARARARVARLRAAGKWIVLDRHPLDGLIVGGGTARARWRRRLLAAAAPRPDLVIVLDAPTEVLLERKREHGPEQLAAMVEGYRRLARADARVRLVAADRPADAVRRDVQSAIGAWLRGRTTEPPRTAPLVRRNRAVAARERAERIWARLEAQAELRRARGQATEIVGMASARDAMLGSARGAELGSAHVSGAGHAALSGSCLLPLRERASTIAYLRLARRPVGVRSIRRSARILPALGGLLDAEARRPLPELLASGRRNAWSFLVERAVPGSPASQRPPHDETWIEPAARAIARVHDATARVASVDGALLGRMVDRRVGRIGRHLGTADPDLAKLVRSLGAALTDDLAGRTMPLGWVHGDYWAGNILLDGADTVTGIIDWDSATCPAPPAVDLLHLLAHARRRRLGTTYGEALSRLHDERGLSATEAAVLATIGASAEPESRRTTLGLTWLMVIDGSLRRYPPIAANRSWGDDMARGVRAWL